MLRSILNLSTNLYCKRTLNRYSSYPPDTYVIYNTALMSYPKNKTVKGFGNSQEPGEYLPTKVEKIDTNNKEVKTEKVVVENLVPAKPKKLRHTLYELFPRFKFDDWDPRYLSKYNYKLENYDLGCRNMNVPPELVIPESRRTLSGIKKFMKDYHKLLANYKKQQKTKPKYSNLQQGIYYHFPHIKDSRCNLWLTPETERTLININRDLKVYEQLLHAFPNNAVNGSTTILKLITHFTYFADVLIDDGPEEFKKYLEEEDFKQLFNNALIELGLASTFTKSKDRLERENQLFHVVIPYYNVDQLANIILATIK